MPSLSCSLAWLKDVRAHCYYASLVRTLFNRPFPSSLVPLFQSESKCETILMKMTLICTRMKLHAELTFIWKVSHLDSFWNRGTRELGNGLLARAVASCISSARTESKLNKIYRADELCVNLVCEYFCWMLGDPHLFFGRALPFLILSVILKKQTKRNLYVGSFNYFSFYYSHEVEFVQGYRGAWLRNRIFRANSTRFNDICSKDLIV